MGAMRLPLASPLRVAVRGVRVRVHVACVLDTALLIPGGAAVAALVLGTPSRSGSAGSNQP